MKINQLTLYTMRRHFKTNGLCSHTTPDGKSFVGEFGRLHKKFKKGNITEEELWAYCNIMHSSKKCDITVNGEVSIDIPKSRDTFKTITVWGKEIKVTVEEHKIHCINYV